MVTYVFLVAAALAVIFAVITIAHRNPVINVLSLVIVFFAMATCVSIGGAVDIRRLFRRLRAAQDPDSPVGQEATKER